MRRLLVLALAVMMVLAMVPTVALAEEGPKEEGSEVIAASEVSYTITIPAQVDLGTLKPGDSAWKDFKVSASNVFLEDGGFIDLTARGSGPNGEFRLYDQDGWGFNAMSYQLISPYGSPVEPDGRYAKITKSGQYYGKVGTSSADIKFAGSYKGVMTFTISYVGPEIQDVPKGGSADMRWLVICESGSVDIYFEEWTINELASMEVTIFNKGEKLSTTRLRNPAAHSGNNITCSLRTSANWENDQGVTEAGYYKGKYDSVSVKVVKDGKTYIFKSSVKQ